MATVDSASVRFLPAFDEPRHGLVCRRQTRGRLSWYVQKPTRWVKLMAASCLAMTIGPNHFLVMFFCVSLLSNASSFAVACVLEGVDRFSSLFPSLPIPHSLGSRQLQWRAN
jgi:hypothetical protein